MNSEELKKWFGKRLRQVREDASLTQTTLAERTGIAQSHISKIERGDVEPTFYTLTALSDGLGMTPQAFFGSDALLPIPQVTGDSPHVLATAAPNPIVVEQAIEAGTAAKAAGERLGLPKAQIATAEALAVGRVAGSSVAIAAPGRT